MESVSADVIIVGGGPAGLTLAIELGLRGVSCLLLDEKEGTTKHPQAHATQARTMEHFRRLGFAKEIRALGLPKDYPTDVVYFSRFSTHELTRFRLPTASQAANMAKTGSGSWSTPELPHRCPLLYIEPELLKQARKYPSVKILHQWRATSFRNVDGGVEVEAEAENAGAAQTRIFSGRYLVGCDGARSFIRKQLGFALEGESVFSERAWMGGRMYSIYFRAEGLYDVINGDPAWMYFTLNPDRRCIMMAVNGIDTFVLNVQLKPEECDVEISDEISSRFIREVFGTSLRFEPLTTMEWHGGHCLVADHYAKPPVFLAGDAVHLFSPTGGLGYNTAVEDVVNLGWKLAAAVKGWGGPHLLESFELERRPIGLRNTGYARAFADNIGLYQAPEHLEDDDAEGERIRKEAGDFLLAHLRSEFNIPGITFGVRYDGSPITVSDGTPPPPDSANAYIASACPGGRAPHAWLADGTSLFDHFGRDFTLLVMQDNDDDVRRFTTAAERLGVPLAVFKSAEPALAELYQSALALIRPDHHVSWRGNSGDDAEAVLRQSVGYRAG